jgi:hypothetical protein
LKESVAGMKKFSTSSKVNFSFTDLVDQIKLEPTIASVGQVIAFSDGVVTVDG